MVILFSKVRAFCEEEEHAIMDCPYVPFHIRANIVRHVELQNVAKTLLDQPQLQEPRILVVQNRLRGMELGSQLGP
jgi:hypothetical protein